jgi:branched-chain amino acid transport system permease protein
MELFTGAKLKIIVVLLGLALAIALPFAVDNSILSLLVFVGLYTLVVVGLCLLMGYAGQVSLGQAAFYGIGAYSTAILTTRFAFNPWLAMLVGVAVAVIVAYVVGRPLLKLESHYLALATLAFGMIIQLIFVEEKEITGGSQGISSIPSLSVGSLTFDNDFKFYFLVAAFVFAGILLAGNIVNSRIGRALRAVHTSEMAAESLAIPVSRIKSQVFALSAGYAAIAGSLFAHYISFVAPNSFGLLTSIDFLVMAVIGGLASIWGPIFGAAAVVFLRRLLQSVVPLFFPRASGEYEIVVFGVILVLVMIFLPEGLVSSLKTVITKSRLVRTSKPSGEVGTTQGGVTEIQ